MKNILKNLFKRGGDDSKSSSIRENMIFTHNCAARI